MTTFHGKTAEEWANECHAEWERANKVWEEAYQEFDYMVRSKGLWTEKFGEVLKQFRNARLETYEQHHCPICGNVNCITYEGAI